MQNKESKKSDYDMALDEGAGAQLVSLMSGLMIFFVTLALAVNFGLSSVTSSWVTGLSGALTAEIKPPDPGADGKVAPQAQQKFKESVDRVMAALKKNSNVKEARALSDAEIKSLVQPWMGDNVSLDGVALPALIDIKLQNNADAAALQSQLRAIEPTAAIDSHTDTLDDVKTLVNTAMLFVYLLTGVIVLLAVIAISGIVRSKLLIHRSEVETLHLIGASDDYIASQFRQYTLRGTIKGALIGLAFTFLTLSVIALITNYLNANIVSYMQLSVTQWLVLALSPLLAGSLIAHLTAQATALKELSYMP